MLYAFLESPRRWMPKTIVVLVFALIVSGFVSVALAQEAQPDPAGIATGCK